jgi:hypothetical protein
MRWAVLITHFHHDEMPHHRPKAIEANWSWTSSSKIVSQNRLLLFLSWLISGICYSDRKLTNTWVLLQAEFVIICYSVIENPYNPCFETLSLCPNNPILLRQESCLPLNRCSHPFTKILTQRLGPCYPLKRSCAPKELWSYIESWNPELLTCKFFCLIIGLSYLLLLNTNPHPVPIIHILCKKSLDLKVAKIFNLNSTTY